MLERYKQFGSRSGALATAIGVSTLLVCNGITEDRPRVLSTLPNTKDFAVDPTLSELRVTFDLPMETMGGYSMVGGGPNFPEITGKPKWVSPKIVEVPIKLKPDHRYILSINSGRFQNFRGTNGQPAVPYRIQFRTAPANGAATLTESENRKALGQLRDAIENRYSYRDLRGVDWDARFAEFERRLLAAKSSAAFGMIAAEMLGVTKDAHIRVKVGEETFGSHQRNVKPNINFQLLPQIVPEFNRVNPVVATGQFENGPAYLMIPSWERRHAEQLKAASRFVDELGEQESLIIDLRLNSGGDELLAREIAGRFVSEPVVYAKHKYRASKSDNSFSPVSERVLSPTPNVPRFNGQVVVLMGPRNMSSCEAFLLMMKQVPNCKLIGMRSYGSSGNPKPVELDNGVTAFLPSWIAMTAEGKSFEGVGIEPDEFVDFDHESTDADSVVERALEILSE